jgi:AcrR family transcriptional regulator
MLDHPAENRSPYARIPGGQHGLAPELVSADQRARLNAAMVQIAAEIGYVATTVEDVISRAGVSRRTFYDHYKNKRDCFISAFDAVLRDWMRHGALAYQTSAPKGMKGTVRARLRAGLLALFELVLSDPLGARVLFIETLNCGSSGLQRLEHAVDELERILERAFGLPDGPPELPPEMITVIVGGVLEIVTARLRHSRTDELSELAEPLLEWMLSYRSSDAAALVGRAREDVAGSMPAPAAKRTGERGEGEPGSLPLWRDESVRPVAVREPRDRIIEAAAQIASDRGYGALSLNEIARAARVSHHTLRKYFASKNEAFMAAYEAGSRATIAYCLKAYSAETDWRAAVRAGLAAELRFLAMHPELARIGFLEVYAAGSQLLELRETELQLVTAALEPGYRQKRRSAPPHPIVSEAIAGGIYQLMRDLVLHHGPEQLPSLSPDVTYAALAPFTGAKAAASVARQPVSSAE